MESKEYRLIVKGISFFEAATYANRALEEYSLHQKISLVWYDGQENPKAFTEVKLSKRGYTVWVTKANNEVTQSAY